MAREPQREGRYAPSLEGVRAFVLDADATVRRTYVRSLVSAGATARAVGSLKMARPELIGSEWDLLVVDFRLPDGNALPLARSLSTHLGLIVASAHHSASTSLAVQRAGGIALPKPIGAHLLLGAARAVLRSRANLPLAPRAIPPRPITSARMGSRETAVLDYLRDRPGMWASARAIAAAALGRDDPSASILVRQYLFRIRRKLGDRNIVIEHERARGYRLRAAE